MSGVRSTRTRSVTAMTARRRARLTFILLLVVAAMVIGYSVIFHAIMAAEGQSHSWLTGIYWTITTMSTLGYGDITFTSDVGRIFSMWVLVSGALYILTVLPFFLAQYVIVPWLDRRDAARTPRRVPDSLRGHLILVGSDAVTQTLMARAERSGIPSVLLVEDPDEARQLHDQGFQVVLGPLDSAKTYRNAGVERAALTASTRPDTTNTNVAFTIRQVSKEAPIAVTANKEASVDVLELAGADHVIQLGAVLGQEMADRVLGTTGAAHPIGNFGATIIAEAAVRGTPLEGLTVREAKQRMRCRVRILAIMRKGRLRALEPEQKVTENTVLILAGTQEELDAYDEQFRTTHEGESPVLILGGGRVGRAAAKTLERTGVPYTVVEQLAGRAGTSVHVIEGDAVDLSALQAAGLDDAQAALVTTHDDDLNVYLTLYCRRLQPDLQVVSRATQERNVATLYRAGADGVLSYATIGATSIWNEAGLSHRVVIAEGNELFLVPRPASLAQLTVRNPEVFRRTGCHIVAACAPDGTLNYETERIPAAPGIRLLMLGNRHAEARFRQIYLHQRAPGQSRWSR